VTESSVVLPPEDRSAAVPIKSLLSETVLDVTKTEIVCKAFDDAWALLRSDGAADADPAKSSIIRTILAKRIIEMAHRDAVSPTAAATY
jgi:hypothetical protein